ncbi:MAG: metal ABC transporter substrate-binding protein [Elusimicrobiota bacterium]
MRLSRPISTLLALGILAAAAGPAAARLRVVTTLPDYADFVKRIGGDRVSVEHIVLGDQDAHFIRPKPSFVNLVRKADVLVETGLDLELWLPTVVDRSGNTRVRSGQEGYVSAAQGMPLLEKPGVMSRSEGGVHIYGNTHVTCSPLQMRIAARNIANGLIKNDPEGKTAYLENLKALEDELDRRIFGAELVRLLGGETLADLAQKGRVVAFLEENEYKGAPMIERLGGWMKEMLPLRGASIVSYHKNWVYFLSLFGLNEAGTIEPKPGIPPSPKHVTRLVELMRERGIRIILAANYFDKQHVRTVAAKVGAEPVIVPLYVGGAPGADDYFQLVDHWVASLLKAARKVEVAR